PSGWLVDIASSHPPSQIVSESPLERLSGAEQERLHGAFGGAERLGHVAVRQPVHPGQQEGGPLLRRQLRHERFEPLSELPGRGTLFRRHGGGVGQGRSLGTLLAVAPIPQVDPEVPFGTPHLVQAEVRGDREQPGGEAALRTVAMSEAEDLDEYVLRHLLGPGLAADEPASELEDARAELPKEVLERRLLTTLAPEHQRDVRVRRRGGKTAP